MPLLLRRWKQWLPWLFLIIVALVVVAAVLFYQSTIPPTPSAFYTPPDPLPAGAPGTILRSEPITDNLPEGALAWRVLYLSTGVDGEPIAVSGLVIAPAEASADPRPVIAWAHGTLGVLPQCGTSHAKDPFEHIPQLDLMIQEGFVVAATDYPGLGTPGIHPYLVGPVEAAAVLDSVRAARQLDANAGERFAVWGHSQGGHAALWTAQMAAGYAPDLTLVAAAAAAPAIDLSGILEAGLDKRVGAILVSEALYAWSQVYPDVDLDGVVKPEARQQFEKLAQICITTPTAFLTLGEVVPPSEFLVGDPTQTEPIRTLLAANTPDGSIDVPLLIAHGTADIIIPFAGSEAAVQQRCAAGEAVQFMRYPGDNHDPVLVDSGVATVGWIEDAFAGRPTGSTCGE